MKPILKYQGSKTRILSQILPLFELYERELYVEPFGGGGAVFFGKEPEPCEVYNDYLGILCNFFRVLRSQKNIELLEEMLLTPYSREFFHEAKDLCLADESSLGDLIHKANFEDYPRDVVLAYALFYAQTTSYCGAPLNSFGAAKNNGHWVCRELAGRRVLLQEAYERFKRVEVENLDCLDCIKKYDSAKTLFYLDPPYDVPCSNRYRASWNEESSRRLVSAVLESKGKFVISCYDSPVYQELLTRGYTRKQIQTRTSIPTKRGETTKRVETVYYSPNCSIDALQQSNALF